MRSLGPSVLWAASIVVAASGCGGSRSLGGSGGMVGGGLPGSGVGGHSANGQPGGGLPVSGATGAGAIGGGAIGASGGGAAGSTMGRADAGDIGGDAAGQDAGGPPTGADCGMAQPWPGPLVLNNQPKIDSLPFISEVDGDLYVTAQASQLTHLGCLRKVTGQLQIISDQNLATLDGLQGLESVGGDLIVGSNDSLTTLDGLSSLQIVAGTIRVNDNPALTSVAALGQVTSSYSLEISRDDALTKVAISGVPSERGDVTIWSNQNLVEVTALAATSIGTLTVVGNPQLTSIKGLSSITATHDLTVTNNTSLQELEGLQNVAQAAMVTIQNCPITTVTGLRGLVHVSGLAIMQTSLSDVSGLGVGAGGPLVFDDGGTFTLSLNPVLAAVGDFNAQATTLTQLLVADDPRLTDFPKLSGLTGVEYLQVDRDNRLTSLQNLEGLVTADAVEIVEDPKLVDLTGLDQLTSAAYAFTIKSDPGLTSLHGLESLGNVVLLQIQSNPELDDIDALAGLFSMSEISASDNALLPTCQVQALASRTGATAQVSGNDDVTTCP
jgi:hypothetical protein